MTSNKYIKLGVLISILGVVLASQSMAEQGEGNSRRDLFLVAANLYQGYADSDPVEMYKLSDYGQLEPSQTLLQGRTSTLGKNDWTFVGIYSIHEIGPYLLVEYPHLNPSSVIFVDERSPQKAETIKYNTEDNITRPLGHALMEAKDGTICDLWPLSSQTLPTGTEPAALPLDASGQPLIPRTIVRSACKQGGKPLYIRKDDWSDFKNLQYDGSMSQSELALLTDQDGRLVRKFSFNKEDPIIDLNEMPAGFGPRPRQGSDLSPRDCFNKYGSVACTGGRGSTLEAASNDYLIISIGDEKWEIEKTGPDHNKNVFYRTSATGQWKRLAVLPVAPTHHDKMYYRLFGNWLVTSASSALVSALAIRETVVPDILTVVETGKQRNDLKIASEPQATSSIATLPSRRITLWNLADGRRVDVAIPEDDSEVVHIFDDHRVLLRIHDKLFFAEILGSKLNDYKLVAYDSAIPQVHWAFYADH